MTVSRVPQSVQRASVAPATDVEDLLVATALLGVRTTLGAARLATAPARLALRAPLVGLRLQRQLDVLALQGRGARVALRQALDDVLAGPLPETVADALVEHKVVQRMASRLLADPEVREALAAELRSAVADQGTSLATEVGDGVRGRSESLDLVLERKLRGLLRRPREAP
jgi:hypothetical protein